MNFNKAEESNHGIASFLLQKVGTWKGKYKRIFTVGTRAVTTYNPNTLESTNNWSYKDVVSLKPAERGPGLEFVLTIAKGKKHDTMRFSCENRSELIYEFLHAKNVSEKSPGLFVCGSFKHHWSGNKLPVELEVLPFGVVQLVSQTIVKCYPFHLIEAVAEVDGNEAAVVVVITGFSRLHVFDVPNKKELIKKMQEVALNHMGVVVRQGANFKSMSEVFEKRLGKFFADEHLTSLVEFPVHKMNERKNAEFKRLLCLTETCLVERDPDSYAVCTLKPLSEIFSIVRNPEDEQSFTVEFLTCGSRNYRATDRDALLATLLDGVRSSGNRDIHVRSFLTNRAFRLTPLFQLPDEEIETMHLKWLIQTPSTITAACAVERFISCINYSGLQYAHNPEGIFFGEKKEKLINAALMVLVEASDSEEHEFLALRRLVASRTGFAAFTNLPGFREKLGLKIVKALNRDKDHVTQAALDVLAALMEPMYDESDIRQEQLNKTSLLSSAKFLEGILGRFTHHVHRKTGALVVMGVLDFLTFALCAPYSETTDGGHFDQLLSMVAQRGRELFTLLQHHSLSIVKGAGLLMRAVVEEGTEELANHMQRLALSEAALPRHFLTALYTKSADGRTLLNRQLSRKLIALWTCNNAEAGDLLKRTLPAGLLGFLESSEAVPENGDDEIGEGVPNRDNLKIASSHLNVKRNPQWQITVERQLKMAQKVLAKHVDTALQHWRSKDHVLRRQEKPKDRPIVLRRRRQRIKVEGNWDLFYYKFWKDHALANLIWNAKTREELREALENELRLFNQDRELSITETIAWNHIEFEVRYPSLNEEVRVGDYYLRILLQQQQNNGESILGIDIKEPSEFFHELYRRFLTAMKTTLRLPCLQAMALVYNRHKDEIGHFPDTAYIIYVLERTSDYEERDRIVSLLLQLAADPGNVKAILDADGLRPLVDLLPLAHLHTRRAVLATQTNVIEAGDIQRPAEKEKEWYYGNAAGEKLGPFSLNEMKELYNAGNLNPKTRCWAQGLEGWKLMQNVPVFRWSLMAAGNPLYNESDLATTILNIFIRMCEFYPSRDTSGSVIRPLPRVKRILTDPAYLPHIVQLLLTFDPILVEKVSTLMTLLMEDNTHLPRLYATGIFYFVFMYTGSNVLPIGKFLQVSHSKQALPAEVSEDQSGTKSVLRPLLPEAMIRFLDNYGPEEFSRVFLGEFDTPEVIWGSEMRRMLIEKIASHLADFSPRLQSNPRALYQYCPIPAVAYPQLNKELFCHTYYLRHFCDISKFPDWPIREPINFLRHLLEAWRAEVGKKPSGMTEADAMATLGINNNVEVDDGLIRKAYFRLAQKYHPDKNPEGRVMFQKVSTAYQWLCNRHLRISDGPDPYNIYLLIQAQTIVFERYGTELEPFKYPGYPQLLRTVRLETEDNQLFSRSVPLLAASAALAHQTVRCSALNAEELRREGGLELLVEAISRCVGVIGQSSKPDDVSVLVCMHSMRCLAVAARFAACRDRLAEQKCLASEICRLLSFKHLTKLCEAAADCVAGLAADVVLQLQLLQAGVLWHLLLLLFDYDYTLDTSGLEKSESTNKQEAANVLAKKAFFACSRLGGYLTGDLATPPCSPVQAALNAMLTPYLARQLSAASPEDFLKILTTNTENPYLIWDNSTRSQLVEFLMAQQKSHMRSGESDITYGATYQHETYSKELIIGGIFIRLYNKQPDFSLDNPCRFAVELLDALAMAGEENLEGLLLSLYHVLKSGPPVALQCLGRFPTLFILLRKDVTVAEQTLKVINLACQQSDCVADVGQANVMGYLLFAMQMIPSCMLLSLDTVYTLLSNTAVAKETLAKGGVPFVLNIFCNETNGDIRLRAAEVLARMCADRLVGAKARLQLLKFLPSLFADAMRDNPLTSIQIFDTVSENPELIWTDEMRIRVSTVVRHIVKRQLKVLETNPTAEWSGIDPQMESELPNLENEAQVGGIYLRLLAANPGWVLRRPKEFLGEFLEAALKAYSSEPDTERTKLLTTALSGLLVAQPSLLDHVPALGHLPRFLKSLAAANGTAAAGILSIISKMTVNSSCVFAMSRIECINPISTALRKNPEITGLALESMERLVTSGSEEIYEQAVNAGIVPQLLKILEDSDVHLSSTGRALAVSVLKSLATSRLYGGRVSSMLDQCPAWAAYRDQRHDLFIQTSGSGLAITGSVGGVAGYLTQSQSSQIRQTPPDPLRSDE